MMRDISAGAASDSKITRPRRGPGCVASLTTCPCRIGTTHMDWVHAAMRDGMRRHAPALPSSHPAQYSLIGTPSGPRDVRKAGARGRGTRGIQMHRNAARGTKTGQEISQLSNRRLVWWCTAHMDTQGHLSHAGDVDCRR